jgi:DNA oxidative demethylase
MDLFNELIPNHVEIAKDAFLLTGFVQPNEATILADLAAIIVKSPLRNMMTPMGFAMSAAMTNCGDLGWVADKKGYRYDALDPNTGAPWQAIPTSFLTLATVAANQAGFANFIPDACLINQYKIGASMGLHQDKDEQDFTQPIVSVSLGLAATFQFGGLKRSDKPIKIPLKHGDIVVWGGESRLNFHGIMPLKPTKPATNIHAALGEYRYNLTFRKAG